ncbi:MAG: hypothetical protein A2Z25_09845 [Planctomycetes bacterium RBG_16_55_9]|jgi:hypothetical protein|nr:MAG: hypothetical protein A2Z25_09845 [Planctomycetes bacterium RBG_16_55_9]
MESQQTKQEERTEERQEQQSGQQTPKPENAEGDPVLRTIKRWIAGLGYSERLMGVLFWQLSNKDAEWEGADKQLSKKLFEEWEKEIIEKAGDNEYVKAAPPDEAIVTAQTAMMLYWHV